MVSVMAASPRRWSVLLVASIAAAPIAAQQGKRLPHVGQVVAVDGGREPNAAVTFLGTPLQRGENGDVVRVAADAEGRFLVSLLPGVQYVAWAARRTEAGLRVTAPVPRGALRTELAFTGDDHVANERLHVTGLERWQERGPIRVQLAGAGLDGLFADVSMDANGDVLLPPLPRFPMHAKFFCAERLVHICFVGGSAIELPPPHVLEVLVVDPEGRGIPGATVGRFWFRYSSFWDHGPLRGVRPERPFPLATTDQDGKARIVIADERGRVPERRVPLLLVARSEGRADALVELQTIDGDYERGRVTMTLQPEPVQRCHVALRRGDRLRELWFWYIGRPTRGSCWQSTVRCEVPADGNVVMPATPDLTAVGVTAAFDELAIAADDPFHGVPVAREIAIAPELVAGGGTLDLRGVVPIRAQVLDASGAPALGARVLFAAKNEAHFWNVDALATHAATDGSGRIVLPALPGAGALVAIQGDEAAFEWIDVDNKLPVQIVQLAAMPTVAVSVLDELGQPARGATFMLSGGWQDDDTFETRVFCDVASWFARWRWPLIRADEQGRATLPFLRRGRSILEIGARWRGHFGTSGFSGGDAVEVRIGK